MATKSDYGKVASEIAKHLNLYRLAFKTYNITEFDEMIKSVTGEGSRVKHERISIEFQNALLERGFMIYPQISEADDGYVRVIRTNSIVGNLLNAFRYVGPSGDEELVNLLMQLKGKRRADDFTSNSGSE